jgi:hypothetical protein
VRRIYKEVELKLCLGYTIKKGLVIIMETALLISAGISILGSLFKGASDSKNLEAQARAAEYNARVEREGKRQSNIANSLNQDLTAQQGTKAIESVRNTMSANGNVGSSANAAISAAYGNLDTDLALIDYQYKAEAYNHEMAARGYEQQANAYRAGKSTAMTATMINIGATAFSAFSTAAASKQPYTTYYGLRTEDGLYGTSDPTRYGRGYASNNTNWWF